MLRNMFLPALFLTLFSLRAASAPVEKPAASSDAPPSLPTPIPALAPASAPSVDAASVAPSAPAATGDAIPQVSAPAASKEPAVPLTPEQIHELVERSRQARASIDPAALRRLAQGVLDDAPAFSAAGLRLDGDELAAAGDFDSVFAARVNLLESIDRHFRDHPPAADEPLWQKYAPYVEVLREMELVLRDPELAEQMAKPSAVAEGYTLYQHHLMVGWNLLTSDYGAALPPDVRTWYLAMILTHDIGKFQAVASGHPRSDQHLFTAPLLRRYLTERGFDPRDVEKAATIVDADDAYGPPFKVNSLRKARGPEAQAGWTPAQWTAGIASGGDAFARYAAPLGLTGLQLFELEAPLKQADTGAYTTRAGGSPSLDPMTDARDFSRRLVQGLPSPYRRIAWYRTYLSRGRAALQAEVEGYFAQPEPDRAD